MIQEEPVGWVLALEDRQQAGGQACEQAIIVALARDVAQLLEASCACLFRQHAKDRRREIEMHGMKAAVKMKGRLAFDVVDDALARAQNRSRRRFPVLPILILLEQLEMDSHDIGVFRRRRHRQDHLRIIVA